MAKKKTASRKVNETDEKSAICVRMENELFKLVKADAEEGERTPPAQVRLILKEHYGLSADD